MAEDRFTVQGGAPAMPGIGEALPFLDLSSTKKEMLMGDQSNSEQGKAVVDAYYQAGVEGRLTDFAQYLHPDFTTTAPNYLPWGGVHPGAAFFRDEVLPHLPDVLDFGRFRYDSLIVENGRVVALVNFGITGSDAMIKISEHWTVRNGKATSIWVALFRAADPAREARHHTGRYAPIQRTYKHDRTHPPDRPDAVRRG